MESQQIDSKSLVKKVENIAKEYFVSKKEINSIGGFLDPNVIDADSPFQKYIEKVNCAYCTLTDVEKAIINNDFFYQNYPMWWKNSFNRSTYYRYRIKAMAHFLEAFENELI